MSIEHVAKGENARYYGPLLGSGRWFAALPEALREALLAGGVVRTLAPGERLFSRGDAPDGLYAVVEGAVRVSVTSEAGKEALLIFIEPPAWFGEISVLDGQPRTHDAVAADHARVVHVPGAVLDAALAREPGWWRELGLLASTKLRLAFVALEDAAIVPTPIRLARRLVQMADGYGEWLDRSRRVLTVRQEELALMLSTSRQTVNQLLKELEGKGLVRLSYGQIEVLDLDGLRARAVG